MKILWVSAHPEPKSLNAALRGDALAALRGAGHDIRTSDLYEMRWNPVVTAGDFGHDPHHRLLVGARSGRALTEGTLAPDIRAEQRKLAWADAVIVQFPLWWYGMPAILKGWFDRVFVEGYGYGLRSEDGSTRRYGDGTLAGKRAMTVVSFGGSADSAGPRGINGQMDELLFPIHHGIFWYTGMSVVPPVLIDSADRLPAEHYPGVAARLIDRLSGLFTDAPLPFRSQNGGDYDARFVLHEDRAPGVTGLRAHYADADSGTRESESEVRTTAICNVF
ncbi:NAD(P)H-dependent oxidoreductase [Rhodococcus opacus]|uniref:NAD(P)H-dependent oxidoreductase n=1 Tax=Rhodococcus opacus TaxID=37919 RepID=A0AAX3YL58_RHOOP|nr:NAD(P)H-dependent oxidoreductase [Rhodococcus opacus]ELB93823.1 NAD(P)H dehydrogenase (quinone) [Rhodococcus wratislaviensis IFP 2016]MCZ4585651.1 NAD(P)H-dependent oxidoreductase [Rhodococcus opacus]MDJ0416092.1 NAD(P)H-dependent oxidoreductase [Rhodococcus opacus]MDV6243343.1 NAD(P)H-dependent oxidoreductase [Rhodococcus opacus]MDX5963903.1 NAD(P)H-dependent oxidoreductase [Rhodococcus opacus]